MSASNVAQITAYPAGVSSFGMPVIGGGGLMATGNVFFVGSAEAGAGDDVSHGRQTQTPFRTLAYAVGQATANNGDVILVMESHIETIASAAGLTLGTAGLRIVGLGVGKTRPLLRLTGSTAASIAVSAANQSLENVVIDMTLVDGITAGLTVGASEFGLYGCDLYLATATGQVVLGILTNANASRLRIEDCRFWGTANAGADAFIKIAGTPDAIAITRCLMIGQCTQALIWNAAANVATNLRVHDCALRALAATKAVLLASAVTGEFRDTTISGTGLASIYEPGSCASFDVLGYDETQSDIDAVALPFVGTSLGSGRSFVDELLGASLNAGRINALVVTADFTSATWNTVASHTIATVTGLCRLRIVPVCTASLTSASTTAMQLGETGATNSMVLSTSADNILVDTLWLSISPVKGWMFLSILDRIANNTDIGYDLFTDAVTVGAIDFLIWWEPLSAGATVTAGTGGSL